MKKLIFNDIGNNYLEFLKQDIECLPNAINIFIDLLMVLHPLIPFTTETIYSNLKEIINLKESILLEKITDGEASLHSNEIENLLAILKVARTANSNPNFKNGDEIEIFVETNKEIDFDFVNKYIEFLSAKVSPTQKESYFDINIFPKVGIIYSSFEGANNKTIFELKENIKKELKFELKRSNNILLNKKFINNAKPELVKDEKEKERFYRQSLELIK